MPGRPARRISLGKRRLLIIGGAVAAAVVLLCLFVTGVIPLFSMGGVNTHTIGRLLPQNVTANSHGLLYAEGSQVCLVSPNGSEAWTIDVGLTDISTCASEDLILSYSGPNLQTMLYTREQLFSTSVDSPILGGAAGTEYVAVLIDAPEDNSGTQQMIYLFDRSGQKTGQLSFSRQVLDFGFFSDDTMSDLFWTLSLDTAGVAPVSYVTMYNKANGEMTYSITISARVVERVIVTSNLIYANGSGALTAYTYFGEAQAAVPVQGWQIGAVAADASGVDIAYVPRAASATIEAVQPVHGDGASGIATFTDARFGLPMDVIGVAVTKSRLFAFTHDTMYVYSLDGTQERSQNLGVEITDVKQVSNDYAVLWGERDTHILRLQ